MSKDGTLNSVKYTEMCYTLGDIEEALRLLFEEDEGDGGELSDTRADVAAAWKELTQRQRTVLAHLYSGYTLTETAARLGIAPKNVFALRFRALKRLYNLMNGGE